jgi:4-amino-4-deoxy-L-arabinose transferase-like glycosyltransferase
MPRRAVQYSLLAVMSFAVCLLARDFVDRRSSLVAGILIATYPPLVQSANYHLTDVVSLLLAVAMVLLTMRTTAIASWRPALGLLLDIAAAVATLVRPSFALFGALPAAFVLFRRQGAPPRGRLACVACLALGFSFCLAPLILHNCRIADQIVLLSLGSG